MSSTTLPHSEFLQSVCLMVGRIRECQHFPGGMFVCWCGFFDRVSTYLSVDFCLTFVALVVFSVFLSGVACTPGS